MKKLFFTFVLLFIGFLLAACDAKLKVSFDLNYEGAVGAPQAQNIAKGEKAVEPLTPAREGYDFLGWFKNEEDEEPYSFATEVDADFTLYAKWAERTETVYYLAGSFNGYVPDDPDYKMEKGSDGKYAIEVELGPDVRDETYDGHYYKITEGDWTNCYGVDNYYISPAPVSPTGGGLGSIWHWADGVLSVVFDAEELYITDTLVTADEIIEDIEPHIYGAFNDWALEGQKAVILSDADGDGIFTDTLVFPEAGTSDFTVCVSQKWYDDQWGQRWGAQEQYQLDGTVAGMGSASTIDYEAGEYLFYYNSKTNVTGYLKLAAGAEYVYEFPRIYGEFNGWAIDGSAAEFFTDEEGDGIFTAIISFEASGNSDFTVCLSKKWYDDEWGKRWGASLQYKFDGTEPGMGDSTKIDYEAGEYLFTFDSKTNITTYVKLEAGTTDVYEYPRLYGEFNGWAIDGAAACVSALNEDGNFVFTYTFSADGTSDFTVCVSRKWYDDEWGKRWGADEQYKFDGAVAGMGQVTEISYEAGTYKFTYDPVTKITIYIKTTD